jgi:hypothetical protein
MNACRMFTRRVLAVWCLMMGVEFIHGIARRIFLALYVGDFRSLQIGVLSGSLLILLIAFVTADWLCADRTKRQIAAGLIWTGLTLVFEFGFGHFVLGLPWERLIADYDIMRGALLPFGLVVLTLSPLIAAWARLRRDSLSAATTAVPKPGSIWNTRPG